MHSGWRDESGERGAGGESDARGVGVEVCPACGAHRSRAEARFCATCGRALAGAGGDYFPSDSLRSSYHLQGRRGAASLAGSVSRREQQHAAASRAGAQTGARVDLFTHNRNGASTTALAFVTYALVPYLGILFCPGALLLGSIGLLRSRRSPHLGGGRASAMSIVYGVVIFGAQIFLWWILYKAPEWARRSPWGF